MGTQLPLNQRGTATQFSAHICCGQMDGWIKMPLGRNVGLNPSDIVLDGDPAPLPKKGAELPQFLAHVYCGQKVGMIKTPLRIQVGLGPFHIVLDGDPALPPPKKRRGHSPILGPCLLWRNGWMDADATWYEDRPRPRRYCVTWGTSYPQKGHSPRIFGRCLLWPNCRPSQLMLSTCTFNFIIVFSRFFEQS